MGLEGKVALVTGGGQGIGLAITKRFVRDGAAVAIAQRSLEPLERTAAEIVEGGGQALPVRVDVADPLQVDRMVEEVLARYGRIDVLVNNAALTGHSGVVYHDFLELPLSEWRQVIDVNLTGVFLCSQAVAKVMAAREGGRIINVSSVDGAVPERRCSHYAASKGGLESLTRAMALDLAPHNILVNAIAPGPIRSHGPAETYDGPAGAGSSPRAGRPEHMAGLAALLASEDGDFITGQVIFADGGYVLKSARPVRPSRG